MIIIILEKSSLFWKHILFLLPILVCLCRGCCACAVLRSWHVRSACGFAAARRYAVASPLYFLACSYELVLMRVWLLARGGQVLRCLRSRVYTLLRIGALCRPFAPLPPGVLHGGLCGGLVASAYLTRLRIVRLRPLWLPVVAPSGATVCPPPRLVVEGAPLWRPGPPGGFCSRIVAALRCGCWST